MLYGTTLGGGTAEGGTVFALTTAGRETVLHRFLFFSKHVDGAVPIGGLALANGILYGTTYVGGHHGNGIIYSIAP